LLQNLGSEEPRQIFGAEWKQRLELHGITEAHYCGYEPTAGLITPNETVSEFTLGWVKTHDCDFIHAHRGKM
jgi:hypothetical protein